MWYTLNRQSNTSTRPTFGCQAFGWVLCVQQEYSIRCGEAAIFVKALGVTKRFANTPRASFREASGNVPIAEDASVARQQSVAAARQASRKLSPPESFCRTFCHTQRRSYADCAAPTGTWIDVAERAVARFRGCARLRERALGFWYWSALVVIVPDAATYRRLPGNRRFFRTRFAPEPALSAVEGARARWKAFPLATLFAESPLSEAAVSTMRSSRGQHRTQETLYTGTCRASRKPRVSRW
jgi:hypothetical protein